MPASPAMLTIGDFSRATLLTIKTLRHYHDTGLLKAAEVDPDTGYRRYLTSQIPRAQMVERFRELQMPLNEIRQLLASPDDSTRNTIIAAHLKRLEGGVCTTCAPGEQRKSRNNQREQAEPNALDISAGASFRQGEEFSPIASAIFAKLRRLDFSHSAQH